MRNFINGDMFDLSDLPVSGKPLSAVLSRVKVTIRRADMGSYIGLPRVSSERQENSGYSREAQADAIEFFCTTNNLNLVAQFPETKSGAVYAKREVFQAALRYVLDPANDCDGLVVHKIDRYGRDLFAGERVRRILEKKGKKLYSVEEAYLTPVVTNPAESKFAKQKRDIEFKQKMLEAERDRVTVNERFTTGRAKKVHSGGWIGHRPPYECDVVQGELVVNRQRLAVVRLIFELRTSWDQELNQNAWSFRQIASFLTLLQIPAPITKPTLKRRKTSHRCTSHAWTPPTLHKIWWELLSGKRFAYGYTFEDLMNADYGAIREHVEFVTRFSRGEVLPSHGMSNPS